LTRISAPGGRGMVLSAPLVLMASIAGMLLAGCRLRLALAPPRTGWCPRRRARPCRSTLALPCGRRRAGRSRAGCGSLQSPLAAASGLDQPLWMPLTATGGGERGRRGAGRGDLREVDVPTTRSRAPGWIAGRRWCRTRRRRSRPATPRPGSGNWWCARRRRVTGCTPRRTLSGAVRVLGGHAAGRNTVAVGVGMEVAPLTPGDVTRHRLASTLTGAKLSPVSKALPVLPCRGSTCCPGHPLLSDRALRRRRRWRRRSAAVGDVHGAARWSTAMAPGGHTHCRSGALTPRCPA